MRGLVYAGKEKVSFESAPDPAIREPGDVVVRITHAAICGSDLHPYRGSEKGLDPGTVMGHEGIGEVVETGRDVRKLRKGDPVFGPFTTRCGGCSFCLEGLTSRCARGELFGWVSGGEGLQGMQAEYARIPLADSTLLPIPEGLTPEGALLLGDVFSTGWFCAEMAGVKPGTACAVVGCGPVGLMSVAAARHLGAETILAIDSIPERLELARRFGARVIDRSRESPTEVAGELTGGRGLDAVLEGVGARPAMRLAMDLLRPGGVLASVGVHTEPDFPFSPAEAYDRNLTFRTGRCPARRYMERLIPVMRDGGLGLEAVFSHRLPLSEGARGYRIFEGKLEGCTKVVLMP